MMPSFKKLIATSVVLACGMSASIAGSAPASAATVSLNGAVVCLNGNNVVGVWVESTGGGSKWASWQAMPGRPSSAYYTVSLSTATPTNIKLHVGCGGSSGSWWSNNRPTSYKSVSGSRTLNLFCSEAAGTGNRCSWPPLGQSRSTNPGASGNCTWGAAKRWRDFTGYYPNLSGDAYNWATSAAGRGFRVTSTPVARSIVVFAKSSGSSLGHVAWVDSVTRKSDGVYMNITEMNWNGNFNRFTTRSGLKNVSSNRFIAAP